MGNQRHPAQVLLRSNGRDSLLIHTTRVSVLFIAPTNSSFAPETIKLPNEYFNATVNISLPALLEPSFRELNPDVVAMTHPELRAVDKATLTNTFLHLHVQQATFYSLGLAAASRAAEHEARLISIARTAKPPSPRVQACLNKLGSTTMLMSTGNCALRLPPGTKSDVVVQQNQIKAHSKQFCAPAHTMLDAKSVVSTQDTQHMMQLVDQVQHVVYNSTEAALKEAATHGAPTLRHDTRVLVTTYDGYCTAQLVKDAVRCARNAVSNAGEDGQQVVWAAVLAVAPQSAPVSWCETSSGKVLSDDQQHGRRAAEIFVVTKDSCVGAQLKNA
eukprot:TRINITY_DN445_c0_g1_i1.p4 TRINITY_DN445_c0_g1~~TRINITY_DN445_c0_g1_i1.p4  ORF type:complete len:330 (+),score=56.60 TRINITY_DN445_c0_g1_i1:12034-13023(+)